VLVLHIKRFFYDTASGGVVKVGKQVRFGAELDVGSGEFFFFPLSFFPCREKRKRDELTFFL